MGVASQWVDPKTAQRLRARRIVVVDADGARAQAFALALQQSGAAVATITPADKDYGAAHALDADVLLVNEDEPEPCRALVLALRQNARTRWSTVLPVSFAALCPSEADQPDVATIADQVTGFATAVVELTVRAKGKLPYDAPLEPLGPSRTLRALASTGRSLRVTLEDERMRAELELAEGRLAGVRAWLARVQTPLEDAEALSDVLTMASGQLRIEERGEPALTSWNVELTDALADAAAITQERAHHATVPQLSFADILAEARAKGRDLSGLTPIQIEPPEPERTPDGDPDPDIATRVTYEPASVPVHVRTAKPVRRPARALAMAFALLGTSALAFALHVRSDDRGGSHGSKASSYAGSLSTALARPASAPQAPVAAPPLVVLPAEPQVDTEPPLGAQAEAAPRREPTRSELEQAKRLVKRAQRYLGAKRYETAALAYTKALALVPDHVVAMRALIRIHLREQNAEEALHWAEQLASLEPDSRLSQGLLVDARALSSASQERDRARKSR